MSANQRDITGNHIGVGAIVNQGDITTNLVYNIHLPNPQAPTPAPCLISYPQNLGVIQRSGLAADFEGALDRDHRCVALWGLGGSGKTQIALEYAYKRYTREGPGACAVFWVHADNSATFTRDYREIAAELGVDERLPARELKRAVRRAIQSQPAWVLVVDNADNLDLFGLTDCDGETANLQKYLPRGDNGTVVWTSRDRRIAEIVGPEQAIEVLEMTPLEATDLLDAGLKSAARQGMRDQDAKGEDGQRLLEELEWLPLAISQATVFMRRTEIQVSDYLELLQKQQRRWDVLAASQPDRHRLGLPSSVFKSWSITIDRIQGENPVAWRILHVIAYFYNRDIPFHVLSAASGLEDHEEVKTREAIARLMDFSFLSPLKEHGNEQVFEMHKLVHEATRHGLDMSVPSTAGDDTCEPTAAAQFAGMALDIMLDLFPESESDNWRQCEELLVHALSVEKWSHLNGRLIDTADLLVRVSHFLGDCGRLWEDQAVAERILYLDRETFGSRNTETIDSMERLAIAFKSLDCYDKALSLYIEIIKLRCELFGETDVGTLRIMTDLATTYNLNGEYRKAEHTANEALSVQRRVLGSEHRDTVRTMLFLAWLFRYQERFEEAKEKFSDVIAVQRRTLGDADKLTLRTMANLATTLSDEKRYEEARERISEIFELQSAALGPEHGETLCTMSDLAKVYDRLGRYTEAEQRFRHVYCHLRDKFGDTHPDTLVAMFGLATTLHNMKRSTEACSLLRSCLVLRRKALGPDHPDVMETQECLDDWGYAGTPRTMIQGILPVFTGLRTSHG